MCRFEDCSSRYRGDKPVSIQHARQQQARPMFDLLRAAGVPQTPPDAAYGTPELARAIGSLAVALPAVAVIVMGGHPDGLLAYAPEPRKARDLLWNTYLRSRHAHA